MTVAGVRVVALYCFAPFADPAALRGPLLDLCRAGGVHGTLLLAREGINGTIAGDDAAVAAVLAHIRSLPGCAGLDTRESRSDTLPFHRMKVRLKREIVTMGQPGVDPLATGHYVAPADWNALIADPATIVIDTRNDYEVAIGSFAGAVNPGTASFSEFPAWFRAHRDDLLARGGAAPKIAMFCTGGIRCEKATAFLKSEGLDEVYHLKGGILTYLEHIPAEDSLWQGECFVFDQRVAVTSGLAQGTHSLCHGCRMPVSPTDRVSPLYAEGISCPACHASRDAAQKAGAAERERQSRLAAVRGERHVGARTRI